MSCCERLGADAGVATCALAPQRHRARARPAPRQLHGSFVALMLCRHSARTCLMCLTVGPLFWLQRARAPADRGNHQGPELFQLHGECSWPDQTSSNSISSGWQHCCCKAWSLLRGAGQACSAAPHPSSSARRSRAQRGHLGRCTQVWEWRWRCIQVRAAHHWCQAARCARSHSCSFLAAAQRYAVLFVAWFWRPCAAGSGRRRGACAARKGAHPLRGHLQPQELPAVEPPTAAGAGFGRRSG